MPKILLWLHPPGEKPCQCAWPRIWAPYPYECSSCMKLLRDNPTDFHQTPTKGTLMTCPFCQLRHDPEKTHCNDPHTGALIRRAGPFLDYRQPIKLDLTPFGALSLLVRRVNEIKGQWTESLDTAMQQAEEVIQREQDRLSQLAAALAAEPPLSALPTKLRMYPYLRQGGESYGIAAAFAEEFCRTGDPAKQWASCCDEQFAVRVVQLWNAKGQGACIVAPVATGIISVQCQHCGQTTPISETVCIHCLADLAPPLTCVQLLEHARDSMDAALAELQEANKTASGMASLLLLDMIENARVMAARIRQIISAASDEAEFTETVLQLCGTPGEALSGPRGPGGKGTEAP